MTRDGAALDTTNSRSFASRAEAVARARALIPLLQEQADRADKNRRVTEHAIAAIIDSGLFRVAAPREFGGSQLGLAAFVETTMEIASGCGSTGWLYAVFAGHDWLLGLFPVEAQREILSNPRSLSASVVRLQGDKPTPVDGGYRIKGAHGRFCSGIDHAEWIILGAGVQRADGVEPRYLIVPKSDVEVVDDWFTSGLRGTGSRSIKIRDTFVPEHRSASIADMSRGQSPGVLHHGAATFRAPFPQVLAVTLSGAPIGIARSGVEAFLKAYKNRIAGWPDEQVGEQAGFFMRIAEASADVEAGRALVLSACEAIDALDDGSKATFLDRAGYLRNISHAAWRCRSAVNILFEGSGGSAVYDSHGLQRIWRDMNAAAAHNSFVRERAGGMYGRAALGLPPSKFDRIGH